MRGISHDNGEIATVTVNGRLVAITTQHAGVADWTITLDAPSDGRLIARAVDLVGNAERLLHEI